MKSHSSTIFFSPHRPSGKLIQLKIYQKHQKYESFELKCSIKSDHTYLLLIMGMVLFSWTLPVVSEMLPLIVVLLQAFWHLMNDSNRYQLIRDLLHPHARHQESHIKSNIFITSLEVVIPM